jgi:hypothetical protein
MSSSNNYNIASYSNTGISLNLFVNTNSPTFHMYTRSQTTYMNFCKICNMYKCFHTDPVTPHIIHHSKCACVQRNAGNY